MEKKYNNPIPVVVALIPVKEGGWVVARRNNNPQKGSLALIGGYMESGETKEEALAREVWEEAELVVTGFKLLAVESSSKKDTILIFMETDPVNQSDVKMIQNEETQEIVIIKERVNLAFPTHQKILDEAIKKRE